VLLLVTLVVLDAARLGVSAVNSQSSRSALRTAAARSAGRRCTCRAAAGPGRSALMPAGNHRAVEGQRCRRTGRRWSVVARYGWPA